MSLTEDGPPSPRHALMEARPPRGALQPSTSNTLNTRVGLEQNAKKRKRENEGEQKLASQPFVARLYKSHLSDKPITFTPIVTISRSQLPLSWLDPTSSPTISPGQLFHAEIEVLRDTTSAKDQPSVLIARVAPNGGVYAIEEVQGGLYAACKLASWVKERTIMAMIDKSFDSTTFHPALIKDVSEEKEEPIGSEAHMGPAKMEIKKPHLKKGALARMSILPPKDEKTVVAQSVKAGTLQSPSDGEQGQVNVATKQEEVESPRLPHIPDVGAAALSDLEGGQFTQPGRSEQPGGGSPGHALSPQQKPQDLYDTLRVHYLEALYVSKASVAYFAKGPLARARNNVQSDEVLETQLQDLAGFYRESIVPLKKMDLKYRESITKVVEVLPFLADSDDETAQVPSASSTKKRKTKKRKMGKDGLYPDEETYVAKWWKHRTHDATLPAPESREAEAKRVIPDLRNRETYLQILLILETMSLESIHQANTTQKPPPESKDAPSAAINKKLLDLKTHLELLLDRLCIWHTVNTEVSIPASHGEGPSETEKNEKATDDKLRDFCTEVIVPFYASRLPEQCKAISRKLGGPSTISPKRTRQPLTKAASTSQMLPGAPIKLSQPQKVRRSLQRVLTDEKMAAQSRPPSLARSITAPVMPELKRESSEVSLSSLRPGSRGGIQKSKRVDNREVDLNAVAKQNEAKLKRMKTLVDQKKELDDAIDALRKPNRGRVAKTFVDTVEKRAAEGGSKSARKSKNPVRIPPGQGVQVMATPKKGRGRHAMGHLSLTRMDEIYEEPEHEEKEPPSSETTHIPSSTVKPSIPVKDHDSSSASQISGKKSLFSIHETPSRGPSKLSNPLNLDLEAHDSGIGTSPLTLPKPPPPPPTLTHIESTPTAQRSYLLPNVQSTPLRMTKSQRQVLLTPIRKTEASISDIFARAPVRSVPADPKVGGEKSIYESLGWDDDYDELT